MNNNKKIIALIAGIILALICVVCAIWVGKSVVQSIIHHEVTEQKREAVEKIKTIDIDKDKAAESIAKTIHSVKNFKNKVKEEVRRLDSTDTGFTDKKTDSK